MRRRTITLFITLGIVLSLISYIITSMYGVSKNKVIGIKLAESAFPEKPFASLDYRQDENEVIKLVKAIRSGKKIKGNSDAGEPQYRITVKLNNDKIIEYDIWLGEKSGVITYVKDPDSKYKLSEEAARDIVSVIGRYKAALCKAAFSK